MSIIVLGAGVIGVTSAYYLAKAGHRVIVIDRQPGPALETSFANAGEISPGYASPWAAPGIPLKALKWMFMKHAPLVVQPKFDLGTLRWLAKALSNCTADRYAVNKERMLRIADYSRACLAELRAETGINYDQRMQGTLQVFRTQKQIDAMAKDIVVLAKAGVPFGVLDRDGCAAAEPGLNPVRERIAGGLRLPNDETGDCYKFTNVLSDHAESLGVAFRYETKVERLVAQGGRISAVRLSTGEELETELVVVALGSYTPQLLAPLGLRLPVCPVKGYSITIPISNGDRAPVSTVMDETYKVAITRLGTRIRVGGIAEIAGFDTTPREARRATLAQSVTDLFGDAGDLSQATFWCGLRPMTPDGTPVIGPTRFGNLYLNNGHGTLGWTMACGAARILADMISGKKPEIESADYGISRYG
jgi:D-amino-acid dehydrogenase